MSYLSRSGWTAFASASESGEGPANMIDGNASSFWRSFTSTPSVWIDLGAPTVFTRLWVQGLNIYMPTQVQVFVSSDGSTWGSAVASTTWVQTGFSQNNFLDLGGQNSRWIKVLVLANSGYNLIAELNLEDLSAVSVSKVNAYAVAAPNSGVDVSKVNAYAVAAPNRGISISKVNAYAVLIPPVGAGSAKSFLFAPRLD
jgi:hypothetical protein